MTAFLYRCLFSLANFFGLFCFTRDQKGYKISKFKLALNVLKAFVPQSLFCYICLNGAAQKYVYGTDLSNIPEFSGFSLIIFGIEYILEQCIAFVLVVLHLRKRNEILTFFNSLLEVKLKKEVENKLKVRTKFCLICATMFAVFSNAFQMIASIVISPGSVLLYAVTNLPYFIYFSFLVFIKISGNYMEALLEDLLTDLQKALQSKSKWKISEVSARYLNIVLLNKKFHSIFGNSMNFEFCYLSLRTTSQVGLEIFKKTAF